MSASEIGYRTSSFNDWMLDKTGARWQAWFALGFTIGFCWAVSL